MPLFPFLAHPLAIPLGLLGLGLATLPKTEPPTTEHPHFDDSAKAMLLRPGVTHAGAPIQAFKLEAVTEIVRHLGSFGLAKEEAEGQKPGRLLFRVAPGAGDVSAAQAILAAQAEGLVVIGSLSLALAKNNVVDKFIAFVDPSDRGVAHPTGYLAILFDQPEPVVTAAALQPESVGEAPLPPNVAAVVHALLAEASLETKVLREAADKLAGAGHVTPAKKLRARADALDLERSLATPGPAAVPVAAPVVTEAPVEAPVAEPAPSMVAGAETVLAEIVSEPLVIRASVEGAPSEVSPKHLNGASKATVATTLNETSAEPSA